MAPDNETVRVKEQKHFAVEATHTTDREAQQ